MPGWQVQSTGQGPRPTRTGLPSRRPRRCSRRAAPAPLDRGRPAPLGAVRPRRPRVAPRSRTNTKPGTRCSSVSRPCVSGICVARVPTRSALAGAVCIPQRRSREASGYRVAHPRNAKQPGRQKVSYAARDPRMKRDATRHEPGLQQHPLADRMALVVVAVEHGVVGTGERRVDLPGEVRRVLNAGVHALPAHRGVDMRRVAGQEHPAVSDIARLVFPRNGIGTSIPLRALRDRGPSPAPERRRSRPDRRARCRAPGACGPTPSCDTTTDPLVRS